MTRYIVTIDGNGHDPEKLQEAIRRALPLRAELSGFATTDWSARDDVTHACPICFDVHLPRSAVALTVIGETHRTTEKGT